MSDGRGRHQWLQTGTLAALTYNINRSRGMSAKQPLDFSPYAPPKRPKLKAKGLGILKTAFVDRKPDEVWKHLVGEGLVEPRPPRKIERPE